MVLCINEDKSSVCVHYWDLLSNYILKKQDYQWDKEIWFSYRHLHFEKSDSIALFSFRWLGRSTGGGVTDLSLVGDYCCAISCLCPIIVVENKFSDIISQSQQSSITIAFLRSVQTCCGRSTLWYWSFVVLVLAARSFDSLVKWGEEMC